jgi:valyl-tRNA synthetase
MLFNSNRRLLILVHILGVVKITPAHDTTDFEVGRRHDLEIVSVFSNDGMILPVGKQFSVKAAILTKAMIE